MNLFVLLPFLRRTHAMYFFVGFYALCVMFSLRLSNRYFTRRFLGKTIKQVGARAAHQKKGSPNYVVKKQRIEHKTQQYNAQRRAI